MTYTEYTPGQPGAVPPQGQPVPPQPEQKKGLKKVLAIGGPIVGAGVIGVAALGFFGAGDPEVGDCIKESGATSFEVVDCGTDEAQYKVVGIEKDQESYGDFQNDPDSCITFEKAEMALWAGPEGGLGDVYCAEPV